VGAYSPSPDEQPVDESWPTHGIATSSYSRQKAYVERLLDVFEARHPIVRVVRLRPALVFQGPAAAEIRRLFLGHLVPRRRPAVLPSVHGLRFQAVHADDVGVAYARAVGGSVRGPFNVAADPVLDLAQVARALGARPVAVPSAVLRAAAGASWRLHLQPTDPGWVDLALRSPLLDTTRARQELGWTPTRSSLDAVTELVEGLADHRAGDTPPLASDAELAVVAAHAASPFRHDPA
jgi:nucleoside-diphosphate-sugar epimerase